METNCRMFRYCALGLIAALFILFAGCRTSPAGSVRPSHQLSDLEGDWSWRQSWGTHNVCHGDFVLKKDGETYVGTLNDTYEGTYGDKIRDVALSGNRATFTRDGKYGIQRWEGALKEEDGVLKIVDGRWYAERGFWGLFTAEKKNVKSGQTEAKGMPARQ
jgi:hypothetical protein